MNAQTAAFAFADALARVRPLTDDEEGILAAIHDRGRGKGNHRIWTSSEDRQLVRLARTMRAPQIAEKLGRTPWAVRSRVRTLRRKERDRG